MSKELYIMKSFKDPVKAVKLIFGNNVKLWGKQIEVLRSVWENKYTCVKSGNTVGKSFLAALVALASVDRSEAAASKFCQERRRLKSKSTASKSTALKPKSLDCPTRCSAIAKKQQSVGRRLVGVLVGARRLRCR